MIEWVKKLFKAKTKGLIIIPRGAIQQNQIKSIKRYADDNHYLVVAVSHNPDLAIRVISHELDKNHQFSDIPGAVVI